MRVAWVFLLWGTDYVGGLMDFVAPGLVCFQVMPCVEVAAGGTAS